MSNVTIARLSPATYHNNTQQLRHNNLQLWFTSGPFPEWLILPIGYYCTVTLFFCLCMSEVNQLSDLLLQVLADSHQAQVRGQPLLRLTQSFKELYHSRPLSTKSTQRVQNIVDPCSNASCFIFLRSFNNFGGYLIYQLSVISNNASSGMGNKYSLTKM